MNAISFRFNIKPKAIQSVKFARFGKFTKTYQPESNVNWKVLISMMAREQLPAGFKIFDNVPLRIIVAFSYIPPKSWPKYKLKQIGEGWNFYKITKPDVNDNLMKGLCDAMSGVVWRDDCIIASARPDKFYGQREEIIVTVKQLPEMFKYEVEKPC